MSNKVFTAKVRSFFEHELYYILVSFKSWCRAAWGWRDVETCCMHMRLCIYSAFVGVTNEQYK